MLRPLHPCDYGFIPETLAEDDDPLDALVLVWEPTFPGCIIDVRPVGMLRMKDEKGVDEKVLCVPLKDPLWNHVHSLDEVPPHLLKEIDDVFIIYKELEGKKTKTNGAADTVRTVDGLQPAPYLASRDPQATPGSGGSPRFQRYLSAFHDRH